MKPIFPFRRIGAVALLCLGFGAQLASATAFVRISDAELADQSPLIVEGRISRAEPAGSGMPAVFLQVQVEEQLKGSFGDPSLRLYLPGGTRADGLALQILGTPHLRPGHRALLFLEPRADGSFVLVHFLLGAFQLLDLDGTEVAVRDLSGAHELLLDRPSLPHDGLRSLPLFRRWLRDRVAGRIRPADYFLERTAGGDKDLPPDKFRTIVSSTEPFPFGCGDNGGHHVRWTEFDRGDQVFWRVYFGGQPGLADGGLLPFQSALEAWTQDPSTSIELLFDGITAARGGLIDIDGVSAILYDDPNREIGGTFSSTGVLAVGGPWFTCDLEEQNGESFHVAIEGDIVTQDGLATFFAVTEDPPSAAEELFGHELGHTLGLAHSEDPEALMFAEIHQDRRGASLTTDDLSAIQLLYGQLPQAPPEPPSNLEAEALSPSLVRLTWRDGSTGESGFRIERRSSGTFAAIGSTAQDEQSFDDSSVAPGTLYTYRVRAQNGGVGSPYSNESAVETPLGGIPQGPLSLRAAPLSSSRLRLIWQDLADNETEYRLFVFSAATDTFVEIPVSIPRNTTSVVLSDLDAGHQFRFQVLARNPVGDSQPSNPVQVTTFAEGTSCVVGPQRLCLEGGRFEVGVTFRNPVDGGSIDTAGVVPSTDNTGLVWFFDPTNIELFLKIVDGREANDFFWVYYGGITDLEYWVTVTDTTTGMQQVYYNPPGEICGGADNRAFFDLTPAQSRAPRPLAPVPLQVSFRPDPFARQQSPAPVDADKNPPGKVASEKESSGSCEPDRETLCLLDRRLAVTLHWNNYHDGTSSGAGDAAALSDASGDFWFFEPEISEVMVKALDGASYNGHYWLFFGALTDLEYWLTATDTSTGATKTYYNPPGNLCGQGDIQAFPSSATP